MKKFLFVFLVLFLSVGKSFAPIIDPGGLGGCPEYQTCSIDSYLPDGIRYFCEQNTQCQDEFGNPCMCCLPNQQNNYCTNYNCECDAGFVSDYGDPCTCVPDCTGCSNCNDVGWTAYGTGYQVYTTKTCNCNTCNSSYSYRCAAGYYGTTSNGSTGCSACVPFGTSVAGSNSVITNCYLPTTYTGADPSGIFNYIQDCYYTN